MTRISPDPTDGATRDGDGRPSWAPRTTRTGRTLGRTINAEAAIAKFGEAEMNEIFDGFLTCDEKAMAVVEEYSQRKGGQRLMMDHLNQALDSGIDTVDDPAPALVKLFEELDTVPDWVDLDQLSRGAVAYLRPGGLVSLAFTCAVTAAGNYAYGMTRPQAFTGRFEEKARTRAEETLRWLLTATTPGSMNRYGAGFNLTVRVRILHAFVRKGVTRSPRWEWDNWGAPIGDSDQGWAIAANFTTVILRAYKKIGIRFSRREIDDIHALFRYIGYVLGTPDHLNPKTHEECVRYDAKWTMVDYGPDEGCVRLVRALIELATQEEDPGTASGPKTVMQKLMPPLRMRAFMYGMCRFWAGDRICDGLKLPNTNWRYAGYLIWPFVRWSEIKRSLFSADDERVGERTRATLMAGLALKPGQRDIATPSDIEEGIAGRDAQHARQQQLGMAH